MLSPHVSVAEFEKSQTAARRGLRNRMGPAQRASAEALCRVCVEPLRAVVGPLTVNSGYRAPAVNAAVVGSPTSDHVRGRAIDIETARLPGQGGLSTTELFDVARMLDLPFDQIILEFPGRDPRAGWVHIGYRGAGGRGQVLLATARGYTPYHKPSASTPAIRALVRAFQQVHGLVPDGVIGPATRRAAFAAAAL